MTVHRTKRRSVAIPQYSLRIMSNNVTTEQPNEGSSQSGGIVRSVSPATMAGRSCHFIGFITMRLIIGVLMYVLVLIADVLSFALHS